MAKASPAVALFARVLALAGRHVIERLAGACCSCSRGGEYSGVLGRTLNCIHAVRGSWLSERT